MLMLVLVLVKRSKKSGLVVKVNLCVDKSSMSHNSWSQNALDRCGMDNIICPLCCAMLRCAGLLQYELTRLY